MRTVGIHLIWTTYLTWPPGDDRGHWSPLFDFYGRLIAAGHRLNMPDPVTKSRAIAAATEPAKVLTNAEIQLVADVIGDHLDPRHMAAGLPGVCDGIAPNHIAPGLPGVDAPISPNPRQAGGYVKTPLLFKPPRCYAAAIEPNHIHLLIGRCEEDLEKFVGRLKGRTSSELGQLPINATRRRTWTEKYWRVFLFDEEPVRAVKRYIEAHNERRGLPVAPYPWIT